MDLELDSEAGPGGSEQGRNVLRALQVALAKGDVELACRMYEESGQRVAEQLLTSVRAFPPHVGEAAARMYALARDFGRAARLFESLKAWPDAASMYEVGRDFASAARCWKRSGNLPRAARNCDAAGKTDEALALYEQIGDREARADCLLRGNRPLEAAEVYFQLGNVRGEVDALRKVSAGDPRYVEAVRRLVSVLARRNRLVEATQLAADAIRENDAARMDVGLHQLLVDLLVRQQMHDHAERVRTRMQRIAAREQTSSPTPSIDPEKTDPGFAPPEDYAFLKAIPLFGKLSLEDMKDLYRLATEVTYRPGAFLVEAGVDAPGLIVIVEGTAEVMTVGPAGARHLNSLGAGAYLGEISLLSSSVTSARVVASSLVRALKISPAQFSGFVYGHPAAATSIYRLFAENLAERVRTLSAPENAPG